MFTGIVEELGEVVELVALEDNAIRLRVRGALATSDAKIGDSIAVNGVCLTAIELSEDAFSADVMAETLQRTTTGALQVGDAVNLERPVTLATRLGGHVVQGHVDGVGKVIDRQPSENWELVTIELPAGLAKYLVEKGSITVDGTSLTVASVTNSSFTVSLIPETLRKTTLGQRPVGSLVNLEVDVLAKYVERLIEAAK